MSDAEFKPTIVEVYCEKHGKTEALVDSYGRATCLSCLEQLGLILDKVYIETLED